MDPDFYQQYQDLPIPELVKVARTPEDYLPEAVVAAERILRERGISREEIAAEEWIIAQKEMVDGLQKVRRRDLAGRIRELFELDRSGRPAGRAERWYTAFLLFYGLYFVYTMSVSISRLVWQAHCTDCVSSPVSFLAWNLGFAIYVTVTLYYILRQAWLGWSLVVIQLVFLVCRILGGIMHFLARHYVPQFSPSLYVLVVVYIGLGIIIWQPHMRSTFKINAATQSRTLLVAAFIGLIAMSLNA